MTRQNIPTAAYKAFSSFSEAQEFVEKYVSRLFIMIHCSLRSSWPGWVVKADGLAAGKGVVVTREKKRAIDAAKSILEVSLSSEMGEEA